eukprot:2316341-Pleurochrysis_carterae.AAC.2
MHPRTGTLRGPGRKIESCGIAGRMLVQFAGPFWAKTTCLLTSCNVQRQRRTGSSPLEHLCAPRATLYATAACCGSELR